MSEAQPIRWIAASARAALQRRTQQALERWAADWGLPPPLVGTPEALTHAAAAAAALDAHGTTSAAPPDGWSAALVACWFGADADAAPIARDVAAQATRSLLETLGRALVAPTASPAASNAPAPGRAGHWGAAVDVAWLGLRWRIDVGAAALAEATPAPRDPVPRWDADAAFAPTAVTLDAVLGTARIDVGDLVALEPGDVIPLDLAPGHPVRLCVAGADLGMTAELGGDGGRRALRLRARRPSAAARPPATP